jgi:uncharacterized membrane protein
MEELFKTLVETVALAVEASAALFIAIGAIEAIYHITLGIAGASGTAFRRKQIWVRFAVWLLLALEFELAADVLRSAIAPTWADIGQLASIAGIRTVLNYFLEKDIDKYGEESDASRAAVRAEP